MKTGHVVLMLLMTATLAGCSFSSEVMLADHEGHLYYGQAKFDPEKKAGTITFPQSPYGELSGPFTLVPTNVNKPVIKLDRIPLKALSGRATLSNDLGPCLQCQITADFNTEGAGDMKMTGEGTCTDKGKKAYDISFN